jgi:hypothetical protein
MTQDERAQKAVGNFGAEVKAKLANPAATGQPEDQLRGPFETLFAALAEATGLPSGRVALVGETPHAETGTRPDYSVTMGHALVGFVELKAPGKGADPRKFRDEHDKAQWARLKALPNLIYTDGNAFSLWQNGEIVGKVVALDGDVETSGAALAAPPALLPLIADFLAWTPIVPKSARELAPVAARLCRFLRDETAEAIAAEDAANGPKPLLDLAKDWHLTLLPDATQDKFADNYAQAVTFGLLMARSRKLPLDGGLDAIAKELGLDTLIGAALRSLAETAEVPPPAVKAMTRVLGEVDWAQISKGEPEAWLYFYESFLEVYDNKLRKATGSYYTPPEVVTAMVRLADEALKTPGRFGIQRGLADRQVHIADPAMGSGTYLLALLRRIAKAIEDDQGAGAVAAALSEAAQRLYGFELQFGAYAVAELRLIAEMLDYGVIGTPRLFVTDTLGDPYEQDETGTGIGRVLSRSRIAANKVKAEQPITVVIGNPPYKEKAKGRGSWVENGSANRAAILDDWQPPRKWGVGAHTKHLRNLYIYFWRWAAWKVFEQGGGGRDRQPPIEEALSGLVCYITVAGFLNGPGFQKMRADLRRECDEIWVVDCSPEGHQPEVATRIFEGVQHPVCIVLASRSPANDPKVPAKVRFRSLAKGNRKDKFAELAGITLGGEGWSDAARDLRAPFLPEFTGGWADFVPLDAVIGDSGSGVMPGRTWIIAPDAGSLKDRWSRLLGEKDTAKRVALFHPHEGGDRTIEKPSKAFVGVHEALASINFGLAKRNSADRKTAEEAANARALQQPVRYGFRSFDRQWIVPDNRLINRPNPALWEAYGNQQLYLTALSRSSPRDGPALTLTGNIPDLDHYKGSFGGRVFALWKDAAATETNVTASALAALARAYGGAPDPVDVFAYVVALLACPAYTESFREDLIRPGLRVPLTASKALFDEAAALGREVIWLMTFGDRFAEGRPSGVPRLPVDRRPFVPADGAIPTTPEGFPDTIDYDAGKQRLLVGTGHIDNVTPAMWTYQVSGKQVLRQWFSYRKKDRTRPQIGDRRPPSKLGDVQPDHWLSEYTEELLNVLNVLGLLIDLEPKQADLLKRVVDGPFIPAGKVV